MVWTCVKEGGRVRKEKDNGDRVTRKKKRRKAHEEIFGFSELKR